MNKKQLIDVLLDKTMYHEASLYIASKRPITLIVKNEYGLLKTWYKFADPRDNHAKWLKDLNRLTKYQLILLMYWSCLDAGFTSDQTEELYGISLEQS